MRLSDALSYYTTSRNLDKPYDLVYESLIKSFGCWLTGMASIKREPRTASDLNRKSERIPRPRRAGGASA